ncbi:DNA-binding MarR family transcriptional regulator [Thioclava sp. ES.031]|uniref:MarR family winged helix-turn-helix transcriptional regulator n=1 Tax=Thioclava sp. ES.031 TaxID=1798203 RepID=UPI000C01B116|nr:MarR family winged helix-turn-helix transcriptional regulator [Thioclava sp. ES.031]PFG64815.1 DNA-binding MarR family transcriptional regulator [Thioclava sp. ES.031]
MSEDAAEMPEFDLYSFTPYRLAVAAEKLSERLARQYRDRFGISIPEWRVLVHLAQSDDVSVRDIEARVAMEKSKVSRAASRLEASGLIAKTRHEGDKRLVKLRLTAKRLVKLRLTANGRAMMAELLVLANAFQAELVAELGDAATKLETGLDRLLALPPR